jgi:hypothetical protein
MNPIVARQPGVMAEQIAHSDAIGRNGIMRPRNSEM